jgi:dienelactone hydrolase
VRAHLLLAAALGALAGASAACAQAAGAPERAPLSTFAYDRSAPLDLRTGPAEMVQGMQLSPISFASPRGGRATGLLVVPPGRGPFAGIVLQHGMPGSAAITVPQALYLARHGAVVVALDAPFARRGGRYNLMTEADSAEQVQLIVDLQRAVDLLLARRDVDPARLAYVGRSYGGAMGALLAGVDRRFKTFVLMVGDGGLVAHVTGPEDEDFMGRLLRPQRERWLAAMRPIEPSLFVGLAPPASILFQNGRRDDLVPVRDAEALHAAARSPKTVRWYDAGHSLNAQAYVDQLDWLHRAIGTTPPGPGDQEGPTPVRRQGNGI